METPYRICSCCKCDLTNEIGLTVTIREVSSTEQSMLSTQLLCEECCLKFIEGLDYEEEGELK